MDPISHVVFGQTLITAFRPDDSSRRARAIVAVVGALAPDIDAVLIPAGWDVYLRAHEIGTHSLVGIIPLACMVALAVKMFSRRSRFGDLFAAALIGCASHLTLDLLSGARIKIGWPLVNGRISRPLVAMAEPWLIAIFAAGALALVLARDRRRVAAQILGVLLVFFTVKAALLARALSTLPTVDRAPVVTQIVEARWASLTEWNVFDRGQDVLRQWRIGPARPPVLVLSWPVGTDTPLIGRSRSLSTVRNFLAVHELGFAGEIADASEHGTRILWSDVRFCWLLAIDDEMPASVVLAGPDEARSRIACGLWFGGDFDRAGQATREVVKVGGWWQTREPAPRQ